MACLRPSWAICNPDSETETKKKEGHFGENLDLLQDIFIHPNCLSPPIECLPSTLPRIQTWIFNSGKLLQVLQKTKL